MTAKRTKRTIMVILVILTIVTIVVLSRQAFGRNDPNAKSPDAVKEQAKRHEKMRSGIKGRVEELAKELGLTEQQKKAVTPIFENEMKHLLTVMSDKSLSKDQKMEKIDAILQGTEKQLSRILTPEQQQKYAEIKLDTHEDRPEFAERHIERISVKLNLTESQKKAITPIIVNKMKTLRAVGSNRSLTKEQRSEKLKAIHQTAREQLSRILTPEQQQKYVETGKSE